MNSTPDSPLVAFERALATKDMAAASAAYVELSARIGELPPKAASYLARLEAVYLTQMRAATTTQEKA